MQPQALLQATEAGKIQLSEIADTCAAGIVSRTVLQSPELRVVHFSFAAGQELTMHTNRNRALVHVLGGKCEFFFNDEWQELREGDFLHMTPNHPHAVRACEEPFTMLLTLGVVAEQPSKITIR